MTSFDCSFSALQKYPSVMDIVHQQQASGSVSCADQMSALFGSSPDDCSPQSCYTIKPEPPPWMFGCDEVQVKPECLRQCSALPAAFEHSGARLGFSACDSFPLV